MEPILSVFKRRERSIRLRPALTIHPRLFPLAFGLYGETANVSASL